MPIRGVNIPGFREYSPNRLWAAIEPLWDQAWPKAPLPRHDVATLLEFYASERQGASASREDLAALQSRLPVAFQALSLGVVEIDVLDFLLNYRADRVLTLVGPRGSGKSTLLHYSEAVLRLGLPHTYPSLIIVNGNNIASSGRTRGSFLDHLPGALLEAARFARLDVAPLLRRAADELSPRKRGSHRPSKRPKSPRPTPAHVQRVMAAMVERLRDSRDVVLIFDNLDHLPVDLVEDTLELARTLYVDSKIGTVVCIRPGTRRAIAARSTAKAFVRYSVEVNPPVVAAWLEKFGKRLAATAAEHARHTPLPLVYDVQLTPSLLTDVVRRLHILLTALTKRENAVHVLEAVSAGDIRQLIRYLRRMASNANLPVEALLRGDAIDLRAARFHPISGMLEAGYTAFAPDGDCPNLLHIDSPSSGDLQFLLQHRILCLVDAALSLDVRTLVSQVGLLGCAEETVGDALRRLHASGMIEFTDTEQFTTGAAWPDQVLLTASGSYHLHFLLSSQDYALAVVTDVPLDHGVLRRSGSSFLGRFHSLLEYTEAVAVAEDRVHRLLLETKSPDAWPLMSSMKRGGLLSECAMCAVEDAATSADRSMVAKVRALARDSAIVKRMRDLDRRRRDVSRRLEELENRLSRVTRDVAAGRGGFVVRSNSSKRVMPDRGDANAFYLLADGPRSAAAPTSAEWIPLEPDRTRSLGVLAVEREGGADDGRLRLRLLDVARHSMDAVVLGPWVELSTVHRCARKWLDRVGARVIAGASFGDDIDAAGIALSELMLSPTGRSVLAHAVLRMSRVVIFGDQLDVPWEWIRPGSLSDAMEALHVVTDVVRWPTPIAGAEEQLRLGGGRSLQPVTLDSGERIHACIGLGNGLVGDLRELGLEAAKATSIHLCGHHLNGVLQLRTANAELELEREHFSGRRWFGRQQVVLSACNAGAEAYTRSIAAQLASGGAAGVWAPVVPLADSHLETIELTLSKSLSMSIDQVIRAGRGDSPLWRLYVRYGE